MARRLSRQRAYSLVGRLLLKARLPRLALPMLDRAVELEPRIGVLHRRRARALMELGRWEESALAFQAAVVLDPDSEPSWTSLVTALANLSRFDEAGVVCRRAAALVSRNQVYEPPRIKAAS